MKYERSTTLGCKFIRTDKKIIKKHIFRFHGFIQDNGFIQDYELI